MTNQYKLSTRGRVGWGAALLTLPLVSVGTVFGLTDDSIVKGQNSKYVEQFASPVDSITAGASGGTPDFPSRWGKPGGTSTLVLYDADGEYPEDAELYAIATANLATHFGEAEVKDVADYTADTMDIFDAVIYVASEQGTTPPKAFLDDVREGMVPVLWADQNIDDLARSNSPDPADFIAQYGWDPTQPLTVNSEQVEAVTYKDRRMQRHTGGTDEVNAPRIVDPSAVQVLASGICGDPAKPTDCAGGDPAHPGTELPWVIRSGNLTYIAELPLNYTDRNEMYLVFSDLYYDLLAPGTAPRRQAAVRLEDVGPEANPSQLRAVADYFHAQGVPFQVAVMPVQIDRTKDKEGWYGLSLKDTPEVVEALKYMQERGGTLIQHGTTHQYGNIDNPYSGRSGDDYEFYHYGCSATELPPYEFETCENDSYVRKIGPLPQDSVEDHKERIAQGRQIMIDAGLGEPKIFETPHYTASVNAYVAMSELYDARYEQTEYYAGMLSGREISPEHDFGQFFPYTVQDIYGTTVYPENLENITLKEQNNHPARSPEVLLERAEANLAVRESTASFYFHPFLDLKYLDEVVTGLKDMGYTFVPVTEL